MVDCAASKFLNQGTDYIRATVQDILEGSMREIVGKLKLTSMVTDREQFNKLVRENVEPDLNNIGLEIKTFNVQNFVDKDGVIENLGIDNIVRIKKDAAISRANAEKDIATAQAGAKKLANDASVDAETQIAVRNNELDIRKSELKQNADIKRANADIAYNIQKENQNKTFNETQVAAQIALQEKNIELKERESQVTEQTLNAKVRRVADAQKYQVFQEAEADLYRRTQEAEAKKAEALRNADAQKALAEADKYTQLQQSEAIRAKGEAEAAAILAKGEAEAKAIEAKGMAEAKGMDKKADAMQKMNTAAVAEMFFKILPETAKNLAEPMSKIGNITMFGDGNTTKMMTDITGVFNQVLGGIGAGTGLDIKSVLAGAFGHKLVDTATAKNEDPGKNEVFTSEEVSKKHVKKD